MQAARTYRVRLDRLLEETLEQPREERASFLARACEREPGLRADVEELLRLVERPQTSLDAGRLADGPLWRALVDELETPAAPGMPVGPWRIVRELGRGGMGAVYLAERADGAFALTAALKLLRPGADSEEVIRRFEREREILARLQHPNVARILDGGRTDDGRPYIVMEYVDGRPLDAYCDERHLDLDGRLRLFLEVGRAVYHAHRCLVVHRDLKPSNIVVTAEGQVKLLDFGIAKLVAREGEPSEPPTRTLSRLLTPEYASPEQVLGQPITTASDVYQLGLLLYELLTGHRAHQIDETSPSALQEAVCERQATRPSERVTTFATGEAAAARHTTPAALSRRLRGDLDNIVLMALRKEPERRYASVEQMMEDVERFQRGLPVRARPDTLGYRVQKFVRRHAVGVAAAAAFALLLAGYAVTITSQARELARERDRARTEARKAARVRDFLVGLFEAADPFRTRGEQVTAAELVDAGARVAREELAPETEVQAEMFGVLGAVLQERASYARAEPLLADALALQRRLHPGDHPDLAGALTRYADILAETGQLARAEQLARESVAIRQRLFGPRSEEGAEGLETLNKVLCYQGRHAEAEALTREALSIRRGLPGEQGMQIAALSDDLGTLLSFQDRFEEAEASHRAALSAQRRLLPRDHPALATTLNNLAVDLASRRKFAEAEPLYRESLEMRRRIFGDTHPMVANVRHSLGALQRRMGKPGEAVATHREVLAIRVKTHGAGHPNVGMSLNALAVALRDDGHTREAEQRFREALVIFRKTRHPLHGLCALDFGRLLMASRRHDEAAPILEEALAVQREKRGETSVAADEARLGLGLCRAAQGSRREAAELLDQALARVRGAESAEPQLLADAEAALASLRPPR